MYRHARVMRIMGDAEKIVVDLFARYRASRTSFLGMVGAASEVDAERARRIADFIAGMTDRFALIEHRRLFDSTPDLR